MLTRILGRPSTFSDIEERKPVWVALSSLFLDTDTSLFRESNVKVLASSPYSVTELDRILTDEVYPACKWNLFSVAGEWTGFDEDWLVDHILRRRSAVSRVWNRVFANLSVLTSMEWKTIRERVQESRATP